MGICRNTAGRLAYTITSNDKKVFSVTKEKDPARVHEIIKHEPYITSTAYIMDSAGGFSWNPAPGFTSFIKTVAFLKANIANLL